MRGVASEANRVLGFRATWIEFGVVICGFEFPMAEAEGNINGHDLGLRFRVADEGTVQPVQMWRPMFSLRATWGKASIDFWRY